MTTAAEPAADVEETTLVLIPGGVSLTDAAKVTKALSAAFPDAVARAKEGYALEVLVRRPRTGARRG